MLVINTLLPGAEIDIGFSGSRHGMSVRQARDFYDLLCAVRKTYTVRTLHHGDCVGADAEAHDVALSFGIPVIIHPPTDPRHRAWCEGWTEMKKPMEYHARDRMIVNSTHVLFAAPRCMTPIKRGDGAGTWLTINWAVSRERPVIKLERE